MKTAIVLGAGGFIGGHLMKDLINKGYKVVGVDIKPVTEWDQLHYGQDVTNQGDMDLSKHQSWLVYVFGIHKPERVYQLAADMGGAGYIFTGENDYNVMTHSASININVSLALVEAESTDTVVFYSSSACIYPERNQMDPDNPNCAEDSAYPADPDSEYGWEKLFSERLWRAYARDTGAPVRIARFHNIFGPEGTWQGGKEKAPAAICRKVAEAEDQGTIEVWGPGTQTRSFLYIDECLEGIELLMQSDVEDVINIGSDEMISINGLVDMIARIAGKALRINNIEGPIGVNGRNSDNVLIEQLLDWRPTKTLAEGMAKTYEWIAQQAALNI